MEQENLQEIVKDKINTFMEKVLDYVQVAVPTPDHYSVIRAKILRVGNNCMREVDKEFNKIEGDQQDD